LACVLASLAFACATPFAAFAALAGAMLPLSAALPVVVAAWIINQAIRKRPCDQMETEMGHFARKVR